jgi:hypothetical protein
MFRCSYTILRELPEDGVRTPKHVGAICNINFILLISAFVGILINTVNQNARYEQKKNTRLTCWPYNLLLSNSLKMAPRFLNMQQFQ